jgi:hypothetical protein
MWLNACKYKKKFPPQKEQKSTNEEKSGTVLYFCV